MFAPQERNSISKLATIIKARTTHKNKSHNMTIDNFCHNTKRRCPKNLAASLQLITDKTCCNEQQFITDSLALLALVKKY